MALRITMGNQNIICTELEKAFQKVANQSDDFKINLVINELNKIIKRNRQNGEGNFIDKCSLRTADNQVASITDKEAFTRYYTQYHSSLRNGKLTSVEDVTKDFDVDIQILQDILKNAFVRAINMEKPFVARETKSIDDILDYIKSKEFGKFLSDNFYKIRYKENQFWDKERRKREQDAAIVNEINGILNELTD